MDEELEVVINALNELSSAKAISPSLNSFLVSKLEDYLIEHSLESLPEEQQQSAIEVGARELDMAFHESDHKRFARILTIYGENIFLNRIFLSNLLSYNQKPFSDIISSRIIFGEKLAMPSIDKSEQKSDEKADDEIVKKLSLLKTSGPDLPPF